MILIEVGVKNDKFDSGGGNKITGKLAKSNNDGSKADKII